MGLFGSKKDAAPKFVTLRADGDVSVVGESFCVDAIAAVFNAHAAGEPNARVTVALYREPQNPHDGNAVAVYADGQRIGYLSRGDAARYAPVLDYLWARRHRVATCPAKIVDGNAVDRPKKNKNTPDCRYGVFLKLGAAESLLDAKGRPAADPQAELRRLKAKKVTGYWLCTNCEHMWHMKKPTPPDWQTLTVGPHVCPECGSYWYPVPSDRGWYEIWKENKQEERRLEREDL
jgi:hypothetical protein